MSDIAGRGCDILVPFSNRMPLKDIERSLTKKYRGHLYGKFVEAIVNYNMIQEGDKIAVAVSGGKDSMLMAKLFQELKRHGKVNFEIEFISMDPGYHKDIKKLLVENCEYLNIPIKIFESGIFEIAGKIANDNPCYMCARMRRGALYNKAQELGCNKLALGHHFNDVIETNLLNILYTGCVKTMLPKLKAKNFNKMELIRPLYLVEERFIELFTKESGIWPLNCACMVAAKKIGNKRYEIKDLIKKLRETNSDVEKLIFNSGKNINLNYVLGWEQDGIKHSFLDSYDED